MKKKISKDIGIILNRKPGWFDLNTAYDLIKNKKIRKYAWGTGEIVHRRLVDDDFLDEPILGLIKTSGEDEIIYGCTIDVSREFRKYLNSNKAEKMELDEKHKKYRPEHLRDRKDHAVLFLSRIFLLNDPIKYDEIKVLNGNKFKPINYRAAVFIDVSNLDTEKILDERKNFESFSDNPFVQLLDYQKENNLTNLLVFLLKNNDDLKKQFLKKCGMNRKSNDFEIYTRKQLESINNREKEKSQPDITFEWNDGSMVLLEAKLFSPVDEKQLEKYKKYVDRDIICISRAGKETDTRCVKFISWQDIYNCVSSVQIKNREQKYIWKYFLGYLKNLGLSK